MQTPWRLALMVGALSLLGACLSSAHSIPQKDLLALAQTDPERRGDKVRVVQGFNTSEQPPNSSPQGEGGHICISGHSHGGGYQPGRGLGSGHARPTHVGGVHGGHPRPGHVGPKSSGRVPGHGSSHSSKGGGSFSLSGVDGDAAAVLAVVVVASAAAIAVVAASSEGARYDGWTRLSPDHPLHLYGPNDEYKEVALHDLTMEDAQWARRAYVRESEGAWQALGRAPLNRQGMAYSVFLGAAEIGELGREADVGTVSHIQLGYFPRQEFGLHADLGFAWGGSDYNAEMGTRFEARAALEAQFLPFRASRMHAGVFAQAGGSVRTPAAGGGNSDLYAAGVLMQLDLTTRLALTARAGATQAYHDVTSEMSLGLSIY